MGSANGPDEVLGDPVGSSPCPLPLRNRCSTDLLLSQRTDRCYEVFRNGSGKKGCTLHERQAKSPLHGGIPQRGLCSSGLLVLAKKLEAHGFDVKAFDPDHIYMRSTELKWEDNRTFKRFVHDLPIAARCVTEGEPGPEIKVADTAFQYFSSCRAYKTSTVGTAVNNLDAPLQMDAGGNVGQVWTRVLHYHYNCNKSFQNCKDEEQFYLANGYGLWQWKHYRSGSLIKSALMNNMESGRVAATLPCSDSYQ